MTTQLTRTAGLSAVVLLTALTASLSAADAAKAAEPAAGSTSSTTTGSQASPTAESSSALVAAEDRRLTQVRTVTSLARWQGQDYKSPYRMSTGSGYSLVLTPRSSSYSIDDLLQLAPQTFLHLSDGSYLLSEHLVVTPGATLRLARPGGLTLRLVSSARGFVSIVSLGGKVELVGEVRAPVVVTSWDADAGKVDESTSDGRAYLRALGGQFDAQHVRLEKLGFWSGRTGGLALTGTDRPNTGAIAPVGTATPDGAVDSVLEGVTTQPAGPLQSGQANPNLGYTVPSQDYVSSRISDLVVDGDAFGLFVSGANGVQISDASFRHSLIDGLVLHRYVSNGVISNTVSNDNVGSGITLDRATTGITLNQVTTSHNLVNGITLSGRPLAEGPSATGSTTSSFGGNSVTNSTSDDNGRYGIQVLGGFNIGVQNNHLKGNLMGVVVDGPAEHIAVTGNEVSVSERHGIALTDGVTASSVTGNIVDRAATGIYVRGSSAQVRGNTVQNASVHGVSLVGNVEGSAVGFNVLAGHGASALDRGRSRGEVERLPNQLGGWDDTSPWYDWFKKLLHPMNALWAIIAILTLLSAVRSRRRAPVVVHPYQHQMAHHGPLTLPGHVVLDLTDSDENDRRGSDDGFASRGTAAT